MGQRFMASSNSAARVIGGDTIHTSVHIHGKVGLSLESLSRGVTQSLKDDWRDVKVVFIEEVSMVLPRLLGAASFRVCMARRETHNCDPSLYAELGHLFGGIPLIILLGDFLQLAPFEYKMRKSLLMPVSPKDVDEHLQGVRLFRDGVTDVIFLRKTFRFVEIATVVSIVVTPQRFNSFRYQFLVFIHFAFFLRGVRLKKES